MALRMICERKLGYCVMLNILLILELHGVFSGTYNSQPNWYILAIELTHFLGR